MYTRITTKGLICATVLLLFITQGFSQTILNFYTKKPKKKYGLEIDSVYIANIQDSSHAVLKYLPLEKTGPNNFTYSKYVRVDEKFNYVLMVRKNFNQGVYLGENGEEFYEIDFVIDTLKVFNYPTIDSALVKINYYYLEGQKHKERTPSESKKYAHWANGYLSSDIKPDSKFTEFVDNYFSHGNGTAIYIQGRYARDYSMNLYGLQLKREHGWTELAVAKYDDQELSISFSNNFNKAFISVDANAGLLFFPYTLIMTVGGGLNYTTSLKDSDTILAVYPKLSLSAGGITIYYSYKFPIIDKLSYTYSHHGLTVALGPKIWSK